MSPELLPYELVQASKAVDVWAIGVLLFEFVTGQSLIPVDKNDDITEGQYMRYIAEWTEADCTAKLASRVQQGGRRMHMVLPRQARNIARRPGWRGAHAVG